MTKEQIVGLAVRLFAIFLIIYVVRHASSLIPLLNDSSPYRMGAVYLTLVVLLPLVAAALLWRLPLTVASVLIPKVSAKKQPKPTVADIEPVAFAVLGIWLLAIAVTDTVYWTTFVYLLNRAPAGITFDPQDLANMAATAVELVIGFWLLFGSRSIIEFLRRARSART